MRHWVIYALVAIIAAGVGAGLALYFTQQTRVELAAGVTRGEVLSLNAPPGTLTRVAILGLEGASPSQ